MPVVVMSIETPKTALRARFSDRVRVSFDTGDEVITEQHHKDDCDIHTILKRFVATGVLPTLDQKAHYGDFSNVQSYQEAQTLIARIDQYFESLPARLRERFSNDPVKFIDFVNDPKNRKEGQELGIFEKDPSFYLPSGESDKSTNLSGDVSSAKEVEKPAAEVTAAEK